MNIKNCVRLVANKYLVSKTELKTKFSDESKFEPTVYRMVQDGLVELHEHNRRGTLVSLTTKGRMYNMADVL